MSLDTETIAFPANGGTGQGYLALPEGQGQHRAVVIQERTPGRGRWRGLISI